MKYALVILFLIGCTSTKIVPIPIIPTEDTVHVVDRRAAPTIVDLDGTASKIMYGPGNGYFKSWKWQQILGKRFPIDSANYIRAHTTLTKTGKYAWKLTGIDNLNNTKSDTFNYQKQ